MRFSVIVVTLLGAITSATAQSLFARQSQSPYPACAQPCLANASVGSCVPSNLQCLCSNAAFIDSTTKCIYGACSGSDLQNALTTAQEVCAKVGVTLTSTPSTTATSSSVSPSSSAKSGASSTTYSAVLGLSAAALAAICI